MSILEIGFANDVLIALGYWCKLLRDAGVDISAYDIFLSKKSWTKVSRGGPEMLLDKAAASDRNLLLSYPDEREQLSLKCLENFEGEYIIHIGEMMSTGQLSSPQAPWGRTTCAGFQIKLAEEFHCVLVAELPRFPFRSVCSFSQITSPFALRAASSAHTVA